MKLSQDLLAKTSVAVEEPSPWMRVLEISIPTEEVEHLRTVHLRGYAKEMNIPGFRKGKVPLDMARRQFGAQAEEGLIEELGKSFLDRYVTEQGFPLVRAPHTTLTTAPGGSATLRIEVQVVPRFELPDYKGVSAPLHRRTIGDADVADFIREQTERLSTLSPKEEPLAGGDAARIRLQRVAPGGLPLVGEPASVLLIKLDPQDTPQALIDAVIGLRKGDSAQVVLDSPRPTLVKTPKRQEEGERYAVTVLDALTLTPPEPARVAAEFGVQDPEELPIRVRVLLEDSADNQARAALREELVARIARETAIHLPPPLVEARVDEIRQSLIDKAKSQGREPNGELLDRRFFAERHADQIRHGLKELLVVEAIADREGLGATREQLQTAVELRAHEAGLTPKQMLRKLDDEGLEALARRITRANVEGFLEDEADVEPAPTT